jgi:quercetin dioxygenase-like cupin family protein
MKEQKFIDANNKLWHDLELVPGTQILPLAEPVPQGSIHRLRMAAGTVIPVHVHPCDEYVYVLEGIIKTGDRECKAGTFWFTPANVKQGSHKAITDVELLTIRLGAIGVFEELSDRS